MTANKRSSTEADNEAGPPSKKANIDYNDLITVLVGPSEVRFTVHRDHISSKSPFFQAACGRDWIEGQEKLVRLPEQDAEAFAVYLRWVYADTLDMTALSVSDSPYHPTFLNFSKLWMLAHYLQDEALCNLAIDALIKKWVDPREGRGAPSVTTVAFVFDHTVPDSPLGKLFLDGIAAEMSVKYLREYRSSLPLVVIEDMATRFVQRGEQKQGPTLETRCKYHLHDEGQESCL
ncbi:hypothetical protein LTS10_008188 [Elasticomyces elasticus]|nr:hypothetical protein LTS10_008188 [Elasticomyces elasticus]